LNYIDVANNSLQSLGNYAKSDDIYNTYRKWDLVCNKIVSARNTVRNTSGFYSKREITLARNMLQKDEGNIQKALSKAESHRDMVYDKYQEARRQESTIVGQVKRSAGRLGESLLKLGRKTARRASESRIGKEFKLATKTLILGSKMFYDFLSMNPNQDVLSWAASYESDFDNLMDDYDEIQSMDEASITGQNTFIEDWINKAYISSFEK